MSGGMFDYKQHYITDLIDEMEGILKRLDIEPDKNDNYFDESGSLKPHVSDINRFKIKVKENIKHLKNAEILTQRIDWFLSSDDGEEAFYKRLKEDLEK